MAPFANIYVYKYVRYTWSWTALTLEPRVRDTLETLAFVMISFCCPKTTGSLRRPDPPSRAYLNKDFGNLYSTGGYDSLLLDLNANKEK
jgi:hypothetical protein